MQTNNNSYKVLLPILQLKLKAKKPKPLNNPKQILTIGDEFKWKCFV